MQTTTQSWHTEEWGTWGWAETGLKLVAIIAGMVAFVRSAPAGTLIIGGNSHLAAVILMAILTLLTVGAVFIRFQQRETVSMIFAILNILGHAGLLFALLWVPGQRTLPLTFGAFFVLGQLTKLQFLRVSGYTESGANSATMLRVTAILTGVYALLIVFILL
jgi:hypothetical protein